MLVKFKQPYSSTALGCRKTKNKRELYSKAALELSEKKCTVRIAQWNSAAARSAPASRCRWHHLRDLNSAPKTPNCNPRMWAKYRHLPLRALANVVLLAAGGKQTTKSPERVSPALAPELFYLPRRGDDDFSHTGRFFQDAEECRVATLRPAGRRTICMDQWTTCCWVCGWKII